MSLILPCISYCNIIWGSAFKTVLMPIVILQKKCLRTITKSDFLEHTKPLFKKSKLLDINQVFDLNCAKFIFKILNTEQYSVYKLKLLHSQVKHNYNTSHSALLRSPFERVKKFMIYFLTVESECRILFQILLKMVRKLMNLRLK